MLCEVGVNPPVAYSVGVRQRVARNPLAAEAKVIQLFPMRTQASLDIAQALAPRQLCKSEAAEVVKARKVFDLMFPVVSRHAAPQRMPWQMVGKLCEDVLPRVHVALAGLLQRGLSGHTCKKSSR